MVTEETLVVSFCFLEVTMNLYVNLCPPYTERSDTITVDVPPEHTEQFMQYVHILSDEKNIAARRALQELVEGTYENLMGKDYDRKNRKNAKRRGRNR
tara:strand:- start:3861 stop:4154 length:294 start_codon:yes stop_codon:yes gene_type:complete